MNFIARLSEAFALMEERLESAIVATFARAEITKEGIDLGREGVQLPSATWTYLINDNPDQFSNLPFVLKKAAAVV